MCDELLGSKEICLACFCFAFARFALQHTRALPESLLHDSSRFTLYILKPTYLPGKPTDLPFFGFVALEKNITILFGGYNKITDIF
jgi:hypothetical protein